jgi:hypothetical protein
MAATPEKNTVRQRKKSSLVSTQRFLPIAEIHHDTVALKTGGLRAVLQVEAINFNLKSETEQQGIISGYQAFVNTLNFPLQIVIRSSRMNIDPYLKQLRILAEKQNNELLKKQTLSYAEFVEKLVDVAEIMQKRFYVIIPMDRNVHKANVFTDFMSWLSPDDTTAKMAQRHKDFMGANTALKDRVNLVEVGLQNIGLQSKRLTTRELIELYYQIYNPKTSQEQKLPPDGDLRVEQTTL